MVVSAFMIAKLDTIIAPSYVDKTTPEMRNAVTFALFSRVYPQCSFHSTNMYQTFVFVIPPPPQPHPSRMKTAMMMSTIAMRRVDQGARREELMER